MPNVKNITLITRQNNTRNEPGSVLIVVVLIVATLMAINGALLINSAFEARIAANHERAVVLQYLADAGIEKMRAELIHNEGLVNYENESTLEDIQFIFGMMTNFGEAEISSSLRGPNLRDNLEIQSTARLPDGSKKTILVELKPPFNEAAISTYSEIYLP